MVNEESKTDDKIGDVSWDQAFKEASSGENTNMGGNILTEEENSNQEIPNQNEEKIIVGDKNGRMLSPSPIRKKVFKNLEGKKNISTDIDLNFILDIPLQLTVEIGRTKMLVNDLLQLGQGSVIELNKLVGEPFEVLVNDKLIARGEIVVVNERFGVRLTDVINPMERIEQLG